MRIFCPMELGFTTIPSPDVFATLELCKYLSELLFPTYTVWTMSSLHLEGTAAVVPAFMPPPLCPRLAHRHYQFLYWTDLQELRPDVLHLAEHGNPPPCPRRGIPLPIARPDSWQSLALRLPSVAPESASTSQPYSARQWAPLSLTEPESLQPGPERTVCSKLPRVTPWAPRSHTPEGPGGPKGQQGGTSWEPLGPLASLPQLPAWARRSCGLPSSKHPNVWKEQASPVPSSFPDPRGHPRPERFCLPSTFHFYRSRTAARLPHRGCQPRGAASFALFADFPSSSFGHVPVPSRSRGCVEVDRGPEGD
ncbi:uncharacterized protein LOC128563434 [Nycticebus coucang]|uniref:uncharacterized protein LOC128563434 n=1 Tax=Nycticebus coucang TaxID=9470 RepID=UPI00234DEACA|nr:uncharacterized protein LOC128563434 [Nycticebus coucang]